MLACGSLGKTIPHLPLVCVLDGLPEPAPRPVRDASVVAREVAAAGRDGAGSCSLRLDVVSPAPTDGGAERDGSGAAAKDRRGPGQGPDPANCSDGATTEGGGGGGAGATNDVPRGGSAGATNGGGGGGSAGAANGGGGGGNISTEEWGGWGSIRGVTTCAGGAGGPEKASQTAGGGGRLEGSPCAVPHPTPWRRARCTCAAVARD